MYINDLLIPFIVGLILSLLFTPLGIRIARKLKLIDDPKTHKHPAIIHTKPIPRGGGMPMYAALLMGSLLLFWPFDRTLAGILVAGLIVVVVGLLDDRYDLSPYLRFGINILCAILVVVLGVSIPFVTNPLGGILQFDRLPLPFIEVLPIGGILAVVWIVWVMNMLNWSKGVDGQMPGIATISALIIGIASLRFPTVTSQNIEYAKVAFLVAGVSLGYLPFNFYGKLLPGYSSTILGFILGVLSILSGVKLATAILVMGVPMTDALFTVIRRVAAKRSPFWHDKGHLHHLLLQLGFSKRTIAVLYWCFSLILGIISLQLSSRGKLFAIILVIIIVGGMILFLRIFTRKNDDHD